MEAGRKVLLLYSTDPRLWHEAILLLPGSATALREYMEEENGDSVWWILTPDGDVYPQQIASPPLLAWTTCDDRGSPGSSRVEASDRRTRVPGFGAASVHRFLAERAAGPGTPLLVLRAVEEARAVEASYARDASEGRRERRERRRETQALKVSVPMYVAAAEDENDPLLGTAVEREDLAGGVRVGGLVVYEGARGALVARARGDGPEGDLPVMRSADEDVRVLPVKWKGDKRRRPFRDAVELMEDHDFGDSPLEAESSLGWYLQELVQAGETPTSRHHAWVSAAGIPAGDRSVHEHYCIARVLEYAAEVDQLNLPTLVSFEALGRRLQLIEQAHAVSGSNPDYSNADDFMGWGAGRGKALVAPGLRRHVADRAKERSAVMKEVRKQKEEQRLRKPPGGKGGRGDGAAASGQ